MRQKNMKAIFAVANKANLDLEDLHRLISARYNKEKFRFMTDEEVADFRAYVSKSRIPSGAMNEAGFWYVEAERLTMTLKQWIKIKAILHDIKWTAAKFSNWVVSHKMVPFWSGKVEDIYPYQARGIIAGLERIRTAEIKKKLRENKNPAAAHDKEFRESKEFKEFNGGE
ncbi:hypothetical protein II898_04250 [bacterium]|nr:hypothetical protein [bacterium]